jgi:hypothetical protein
MASKLKLFAALAVFALTFLPYSFAQKNTGDIRGTVTDPSDALIPGCAITLTDQDTGAVRKTASDAQGAFSFLQLPVGTYTVTASKDGFKTVSQKDLAVHVSTVITTILKLPVGTVGEVVTVEAQGLELNTENGEVGNVMLSNQVSELPLNGRNFIELTTLMPGAAVGGGFDNKSKGLLAGVDISFSGAPANANQWRVNGANNNDEGSQRTILVYPSVDAIQEFKILRNSYGPEYGGAGGAQINLVTKAGGNQFHGNVYYFGRNDALNAENFFLGQQKQGCLAGDPTCGKKNYLRRHDYGLTIGGPIKKDKAFFFFSEEWNRERRGQVRQAWIPTAAELQGNFNDIANCPAGSGAPPVPKDPATGAAFTNNTIPSSRLSPAGQAYLSQLPTPNLSPCSAHDWVSQVGIPLDWREENVRGDLNITKSTTLMINFTNESWENPLHAYGEGGLWGDQNWPAVSDAWSQPSKMMLAKLTSTLGNNKVNDFAFSWSANRINISQSGDNPGLQQKIVSAMPLIFPTSGKLHSNQLPEQICWCSTYLGVTGPWSNRQDLYTWRDDFSFTRGKHVFKIGVLYDRNAKDEEQGEEAGGLWGAAGYNGSLTGPNFAWSSPTGGNQWSDTILKGVLWGANENSQNLISDPRWRDTEFYFGDTWKMARTFTLDYGFRWSFMPQAFLADNKLAAFVPSAYDPALGTSPCNGIVLAAGAPNGCKAQGFAGGAYSSHRSIIPTNYHLVAPRLGFAWDVFGKQKYVLRGGVGQFFARDPVSGTTTRLVGSNPPFTVGVGPERTLDGPTFTNGVNLFDFAVGGSPSRGLEVNTNIANSWQWNLTAEVAPFRNAKLEVGYVGLRGIHLATYEDVDQLPPQNRLAFINRPAGNNENQLFPFGAMFSGAPKPIYSWVHRGDSVYHSLQSMFTLKLAHNSIWQTSYTWSKNISNMETDYPNQNDGIPDLYNPRASRGLSDFDRTHVFSSSLVYYLPTLAGRNGFVKGVAGGWQTSTVLSLATGNALTITGSLQGTCLTGTQPNCTQTLGSDPWGILGDGATQQFGVRPLRTGLPCFKDTLKWINPDAFTFNGYVVGQAPQSGIGQCPGPGIQNVDFSLNKNWSLAGHLFGEHPQLQFRMEFFNLFNHPMFRFGGSSADSNSNLSFVATGGQVVNGVIQGTKLQQGSQFGNTPFLSNLGNREIQYALKFVF